MDNQIDRSIYIANIGNFKQYDIFPFFWGYDSILPAGHTNGPVLRDHYLIQYCVTGKGTFLLDDIPYQLEAGQCLISFPQQTIVESADQKNPWGLIWVGVRGINVSQILKSSGVSKHTPLFPWHDEDGEVLRIMKKIVDTGNYNICNRDGVVSIPAADMSLELHRVSLIYDLFSLFVRRGSNSISPEPDENLQGYYVQKAINFMEYNFFEKITIADVATHVGLNRSYLFTLFKYYTGKSPQEYLTHIRIRKACDFFNNPRSTVNSVATSLGYEPRALTRLFKKYIGISPYEYRQKVLKENAAYNKVTPPQTKNGNSK